ncbi:Topoisomerase 6 subunit B-like protein [Theobroma cacao]|uniref:Topoisomerase 6 subunit B-like protein n=1 Tax=Theobroma cacao TaxID=3641 RepID=A0A061FWJ9_THECC|nr:Topoisomerase 6 subunit B-like protein [Theobroma cacao]
MWIDVLIVNIVAHILFPYLRKTKKVSKKKEKCLISEQEKFFAYKIAYLEESLKKNKQLVLLIKKMSFCLYFQSKILHYMRHMVVITIYAQFLFKFVSNALDKNVTTKFAWRTDVIPLVPVATKHHLSSIDILLIKCLIAETLKQNLIEFFQHEFVNIEKSHAERLIGKKFVNISWKLFSLFLFLLEFFLLPHFHYSIKNIMVEFLISSC